MRVKYLIEQLKEYDPDDELIVAYWDKNHVSENLNRDIDSEQWVKIVDLCDTVCGCGDWASDVRWAALEILDKVAADDIA